MVLMKGSDVKKVHMCVAIRDNVLHMCAEHCHELTCGLHCTMMGLIYRTAASSQHNQYCWPDVQLHVINPSTHIIQEQVIVQQHKGINVCCLVRMWCAPSFSIGLNQLGARNVMQCLHPASTLPCLAKLCKLGSMGLRCLPFLLHGKKPVRPAQHKH